ncbi:MAG: hypothetical protein NZ526_07995, partial [Aquificaceae bacterium]|nr:hypothetical protein [Aquificaceae bacterium]
MEKKDLDLRGLFIIFVVMTLLLFGYQAYLILFGPQPTEKPKEKPIEEKPQNVPSLLLGTTREAKKPQNLKTFDFEKFTLVLSEDGARIVSLIDKKYSKDLVTDEEKRLGIYPLEVFTGDPNIDFQINFSPYQIQVQGNSIVATLKGDSFEVIKKLEYKGDYFT